MTAPAGGKNAFGPEGDPDHPTAPCTGTRCDASAETTGDEGCVCDARYKWTLPENWMDFATALEWTEMDPDLSDAIMVVMQREGDAYREPADSGMVIDGDDVVDKDGRFHPEFLAHVHALADGPGYVSLSSSGHGAHVPLIGRLPEGVKQLKIPLSADVEDFDTSHVDEEEGDGMHIDIFDGKHLRKATGDQLAETPRDAAAVDSETLERYCDEYGSSLTVSGGGGTVDREVTLEAIGEYDGPDPDEWEIPEDRCLEYHAAIEAHYHGYSSCNYWRVTGASAAWGTKLEKSPEEILEDLRGADREGTSAGWGGKTETRVHKDAARAENGAFEPPGRPRLAELGILPPRYAEAEECMPITEVVERALDADLVRRRQLKYRLDHGRPENAHRINENVEKLVRNVDSDISPDADDVYRGLPNTKTLLETLVHIEEEGDDHGYPLEEIAWEWVRAPYHTDRDRRRHAAWVLRKVRDDLHFAAPVEQNVDKTPLYVYKDEWGYYDRAGGREISQILASKAPMMETQDISETANHIKRRSVISRDQFDAGEFDSQLVNLENGVYDIDKDVLLDHDPGFYFRTHVPRCFDRDSEKPDKILEFLDSIVESEKEKQTLLEWLGFCLTPGYQDHKFLLLHGSGGNGKGVYLKLLKKFLSSPNVGNVGMNAMTTESSYEVAQLEDKMANISADAPGKRLSAEETEMIKKLSGGDGTQVQHKFGDPFDLDNRAKLTIAANEPPRFYGKKDAIPRRLLAIEFPFRFTSEDDDHKDKIPERELFSTLFTDEQLDGLLMEAIEAYQRKEERQQFSIEVGRTDRERFEEYMSGADSIMGFASSNLENESGTALPKSVIYAAYTRYCDARSEPATKKSAFFRELSRKTSIDAYDGRPRITTPDGSEWRPGILKRLTLTGAAREGLTESDIADIRLVVDHQHSELPEWLRTGQPTTEDSEDAPLLAGLETGDRVNLTMACNSVIEPKPWLDGEGVFIAADGEKIGYVERGELPEFEVGVEYHLTDAVVTTDDDGATILELREGMTEVEAVAKLPSSQETVDQAVADGGDAETGPERKDGPPEAADGPRARRERVLATIRDRYDGTPLNRGGVCARVAEEHDLDPSTTKETIDALIESGDVTDDGGYKLHPN